MQHQLQSSVLIEARRWVGLLRLTWGGGSRREPRDHVIRQLEPTDRARVGAAGYPGGEVATAQGDGSRSSRPRLRPTPDSDRFDDEAGQ